jgi:hypothetical protein
VCVVKVRVYCFGVVNNQNSIYISYENVMFWALRMCFMCLSSTFLRILWHLHSRLVNPQLYLHLVGISCFEKLNNSVRILVSFG